MRSPTAKKLAWWTSILATPAIAFSLSVGWFAVGRWAIGISLFVFTAAAAFQSGTTYLNYQVGYYRGRRAAVEAVVRAQSGEEGIRLLDAPMQEPWE